MCYAPCAQASARVPNDDLLIASDCQRHMSASRPDLMRLLSNATEVDTGATLRRFGEYAMHNRSVAYRTHWRVGMDSSYIPLPFRKQGLLWWFQVLTGFWIRARGDLRERLMRHEALKRLRHQLWSSPRGFKRAAPPPTIAEPIGRMVCGRRRRPCDKLGSGWRPLDLWFDVGLHIRAGDACGAGAPKRGQRMRRCSATPLQDAFALMNAHQLRGHVFLATDSAEIARASEAIGAEHGFKVSTLPIDRKQHESLCLSKVSRKDEPRCGTEFVARTRVRDLNMLTDTLLDSLLVRCPLPLASPCVPAHAYRAHDRASLPFPAVTFDGARRRNDVKLPPSRSAAARPNADRRACSCSSLATRRTPHFRTPCTPAEVCAWGGACAQVHRYIPLDGRKWCTRSSCRMNYTDTFHTA